MVCKKGVLFLVLVYVGCAFCWPWRSDPSQDEHLERKRRSVDCNNHLDCFKCDEKKRLGQCSSFMALCPKACNPECASVDFADQPYKPCADVKAQGNCMNPIPYSSALWVTVCEKTCCVLENPPQWGPWSDWSSCSKSCDYGFKTRTRVCKGEGFGQTCEGSPFESVKCNVDVPCKGTVGWKEDTTTVDETAGSVTLTIVRTVKTDCDASIKVNTKDGSAVQPDDYVSVVDKVINFAKDETEKTVTFIIKKDQLIEPLESFTAIITADPDKLNVDPAVTTINIKDCTAKVGLRPDNYVVQENAKIVKVTVYREGCITSNNKVCISTVDGTATAASDYTAISQQKVSFAPNEASKEVSITIVDDGVEEQDEKFTVKLGCADPATLIVAPGTATVVIKDDDVDGNWSDWGPYGDCDKPCGGGVQTRSRTCDNPKPAGRGKDCEGLATSSQACNTHHCPIDGKWSEWSSWSEGSRSCGGATRYRTRTCTKPAPQYGGKDCVGESKETEGCNSQPCPAKVGLKPTEQTVLENVGEVTIKVVRVGNDIGSNTCQIKTVAGTAEAGSDFVAIAVTDVVFGVGESEKTVSVKIVNDKVLEQSESLQVKLSCSDPGVTEVNPDTSTITIDDDDVLIGLDPTSYKVRESDGKVTLKVFRKGYLKEPNTGIINTCDEAGQSAKAGEDFEVLTNKVVSFAADQTEVEVDVNISNDKAIEGDETFCVTLTTEDPKVSKVDPGKAEITIVDDDAQFSIEPLFCVQEAVGSFKVKVSRTGATAFEHTAVVNSEDVSAVAPGDYAKITDLNVQFAANELEKEVPVTIVDDNDEEGPEKFKLVLSTTDPGATVDKDVTVVNIEDNDVDGKWSDWSDWSACGKSCGTSTQSRTRVCDPAPQGGGAACTGSSTESRSCFIQEHCPVDGGFSEYGAWGDCSRSCGGGFQLRHRTCTNPAPQYGGKPCIGSLVEAQACNDKCCPVNGQWSYYGAWSACVDGKLTRTRQCNNPAPSCGGKECEGGDAASTQTKDCPPASPCVSGAAYAAP